VGDNRPWSPEEDRIIVENYASMKAADLAKMLPGRTISAICARACRAGLAKRRGWTEMEIRNLQARWGAPLTYIAMEMGRSKPSVAKQIQKLQLRGGAEIGRETIKHAAVRAGVAPATMAKILKQYGVKTYRSIYFKARAQYHHRYVEIYDVDDAMAKWGNTETVRAAATRLGMCDKALAKRLRKVMKVGRGVRVTQEQLDAANAFYHPKKAIRRRRNVTAI
jgi:L-rhamnose mutarotase